jgi:hypothetical protein
MCATARGRSPFRLLGSKEKTAYGCLRTGIATLRTLTPPGVIPFSLP